MLEPHHRSLSQYVEEDAIVFSDLMIETKADEAAAVEEADDLLKPEPYFERLLRDRRVSDLLGIRYHLPRQRRRFWPALADPGCLVALRAAVERMDAV